LHAHRFTWSGGHDRLFALQSSVDLSPFASNHARRGSM